MITVLFSCPRYGSHGLGDATLSHLLRPRIDPAYNPAYEDYDYVHDNSFFTNTGTRNRGYFIIAPDWVSERKGIMSTHYQWPADVWTKISVLFSYIQEIFQSQKLGSSIVLWLRYWYANLPKTFFKKNLLSTDKVISFACSLLSGLSRNVYHYEWLRDRPSNSWKEEWNFVKIQCKFLFYSYNVFIFFQKSPRVLK